MPWRHADKVIETGLLVERLDCAPRNLVGAHCRKFEIAADFSHGKQIGMDVDVHPPGIQFVEFNFPDRPDADLGRAQEKRVEPRRQRSNE